MRYPGALADSGPCRLAGDSHRPRALRKKAAGTALNFVFAYVENIELCREMTEIVREELEHFHLVLELLAKRGIRFRRLKPSSYGRGLNDLARKQQPQRAVDRLLVAGLIEA